MKLELKQLAPYLPYNLVCSSQHLLEDEILTGITCDDKTIWCEYEVGLTSIDKCKPILRPLSDLSKPEYDDFKHKYSLRELEDYSNLNANSWGLECGLRLFEMHFDVFGLIEKGLAININTL